MCIFLLSFINWILSRSVHRARYLRQKMKAGKRKEKKKKRTTIDLVPRAVRNISSLFLLLRK